MTIRILQDASLLCPFPLSLIRDYGLRGLKMAGASRFYRTLTDVLTPGR